MRLSYSVRRPVTSAGRCVLDNRIASSAHGYVRRPALEHEQIRTIESCATNVCSLVVVFDRRAHKLHWLYRVPLTLE